MSTSTKLLEAAAALCGAIDDESKKIADKDEAKAFKEAMYDTGTRLVQRLVEMTPNSRKAFLRPEDMARELVSIDSPDLAAHPIAKANAASWPGAKKRPQSVTKTLAAAERRAAKTATKRKAATK